ncbi:MAG: ribose-5-phosphate isomerase [Candidatus Tagabacteria bacterium RIFCSPLOWO2_01_FULL_42_9]|uniref:Ribose-5-phosphate isomerase n=1 Tax=Candidatus Tagabacteria bacterium RIFCSPLOWO2_01_FULL_42_9 TaxID=1802296 RepID=A0A1G2LX26_9BACT|nr:MAG: ribose-5-phosphate isomerase [Candidatus Tagabacteria bacterium RIFCSPLOWO2_01_FULL_42_9]
MRIYLAADHAGFELKEKIKKFLGDLNCEVKDFGAHKYESEDDYPDFVIPAMKTLVEDLEKGIESRGIILGGSGQGEAMIANRFKDIRAVVCDDGDSLENKVKVWREHNNSNVLSFGSRFIDEKSALDAVKIWLETPFTGESRHTRRLGKFDKV